MPSLAILVSAVLVLLCGQTQRQTDRQNHRQNHRRGSTLYSRETQISPAQGVRYLLRVLIAAVAAVTLAVVVNRPRNVTEASVMQRHQRGLPATCAAQRTSERRRTLFLLLSQHLHHLRMLYLTLFSSSVSVCYSGLLHLQLLVVFLLSFNTLEQLWMHFKPTV